MPAGAVVYAAAYVINNFVDMYTYKYGFSTHFASGYSVTTPLQPIGEAYESYHNNGLLSTFAHAIAQCDPRFIMLVFYGAHAFIEKVIYKIPVSCMITYVDCGKYTGVARLLYV